MRKFSKCSFYMWVHMGIKFAFRDNLFKEGETLFDFLSVYRGLYRVNQKFINVYSRFLPMKSLYMLYKKKEFEYIEKYVDKGESTQLLQIPSLEICNTMSLQKVVKYHLSLQNTVDFFHQFWRGLDKIDLFLKIAFATASHIYRLVETV